MQKKNIVLLSFPLHCSYRHQTLNIAALNEFKEGCEVSFNDFLVNYHGKTASFYNILSLAAKSVITITIISGFKENLYFSIT